MQSIMDKIAYLTQELLKKSCDFKYGNVSINFNIHNGRITTITNTTSISVKEYLNELVEPPSIHMTQDYEQAKKD